MQIQDNRTGDEKFDPRPWTAFKETRDGSRLYLGRFSFEIKNSPTLEWITDVNGPFVTRFADADAAIDFFKLLDRAGYMVEDIGLGPIDTCPRCGKIRISPYKTPPKEPLLCPACRGIDKNAQM